MESIKGSSTSEGAWQTQNMLRNVGVDQVRGDGRNLIEAGLAELALNIIFISKTKTTMRL
jgi:hypothetical protein